MWDGKTHQDQNEAEETGKGYRNGGFEVELIGEDGHYFLFTRRVVKEVKIEGSPT